MLKHIRQQFSGGNVASLASSSGPGRRLLPRLGSLNSLDSGSQSKSRQTKTQVPEADVQYSHDAAGRRVLDGLITNRQWDSIRTLLTTDDGRDYIKSASVLLNDADIIDENKTKNNNTNSDTNKTKTKTIRTNNDNDTAPKIPEKFISIFHHIVLSDPPLDVLSDLIHLIGVSQLLRRDDIRPHYTVGYGTKRRAVRRSSNSARITHDGMAWTPLHTAVAFCVDDAAKNTNASNSTTNGGIFRHLTNSRNNSQRHRVDPNVVRVLLRYFPALPSITCGKASVTPLMIEVSKGPRANMRLVKRMIDACPTSILIADSENRTAVEYALGGENLRLYRNLHHLYNDEMQKMNGLETRKRMAHTLMVGGGGGDSSSSGMAFGVGDVRKRREGSLTGMHSRAVREAATVAHEVDADEGTGVNGEVQEIHGLQGGRLTRANSRGSNRSSASAAA